MQFTLHTKRAEKPTPCVFLDRDGTINVDKKYLYKTDDWEWTPAAQAAILAFNQAGFLVVVISNQSGIGRGMYAAANVDKLHVWVNNELAKIGAHIDAFYYCPHAPDAGCDCRKPSPNMLREAGDALNINLSNSWMIGDKAIDVKAGEAAGVRCILVEKNVGLADAIKRILA